MRKGGEEKGARGARTAPSVDGVVFIFFVAMLMFFFRAEGFLPLGGFPLAKRENFRNFLLLLLKATGEADIKKGPYPGPFPCESMGYQSVMFIWYSPQWVIK